MNTRVAQVESRLKHLIRRGGFFRAVTMIAGATVFAQVLSLLVSPIVTRLYSPDEFGVYAAYTSIASILLAINSLRYEFAIALPDSNEVAFNLLILCIVLVGITSMIFFVGVWLLQDQIAAWTNSAEIGQFLWLLPITLIGTGVYQALSFWAVREKQFGIIARTKLVQSVGANSLQIVLGIIHFGPIGLILSQMFAQMGGSFSLLKPIIREQPIPLRRISWRGLWNVALLYRRFPIFSMWSSLINTLGLSLPALLIITLYGTSVGGIFMLTQRIVTLPMQLIGSSVAQVFLGTAAESKRRDAAGFKALFFKTRRRLFLVGIIPTLALAFLAPPLFGLIFGEDWKLAGNFVQLLSPAILIQFVASPLSQTTIILERQDLQFGWDIGRLIVVAFVFVIASVQQWSPELAVGGYSAAMFVSYLALLILLNRIVKGHV